MDNQVLISTPRQVLVVDTEAPVAGDVVVVTGTEVASADACLISSTPVVGVGVRYSVTPLMTGTFFVVRNSTKQVLDTFECVDRTSADQLQDLWDREFGSWKWDKQAGILTATDLAGNVIAKFSMVAEDLEASQTALPLS